MRRRLTRGNVALIAILAVQGVCAGFFLYDIAASVLPIQSEPIAWQLHEFIEVSAGVGLVLGVVMGGLYLAAMLRRNRNMEEQLRRASGAFVDLMEERFVEWGLTPSERDVAWFTLKGLSIPEIARLRQTSDGTVKAQSTAIYRKAEVNGRTQLVSLFIDDLMEARPPALPEAPPPEPPSELPVASRPTPRQAAGR